MSKYKAIKHNNIIYVVDMSNDLTSKDDVMKSYQPHSGTVFIPSSSKLIYDNQVIRHWVNANIYPVVAESCQLTGQFLSDIEKYGIDSEIELIDGKFVVISNLQTLDYLGVRYTYDTNQPFTDYSVYKEINENTRFVKGNVVLNLIDNGPNPINKNFTFQINIENGGEFPEYSYEELHDCYLVVKTEQLESEQEVVLEEHIPKLSKVKIEGKTYLVDENLTLAKYNPKHPVYNFQVGDRFVNNHQIESIKWISSVNNETVLGLDFDYGLISETERLSQWRYIVKEIENDEVIQTESFDDEFLIKLVESCLHRYHRHEQLTAAEIVRIAKENHQLDSDMISAKLDECDAILYWFDALSVQDKIELYRKYNQ